MRKKKQPKRLQLSTETLRQIRGGDIHPWPDPPPRIVTTVSGLPSCDPTCAPSCYGGC